ncbi:PepSY-associated TM helix domain-containing protein [Sphingomonas crocodyli]|uniref:PepSY domain-containing protein n=1 Tax=Sphingomonas crocodyli TaxID=1979270 RepID=A0A437M035_9SPHN|nr:PepSY-associated TM helix domain-containing protein [Sphingomonas crocodyli]RVT90936.1 PepSY domain-containing protein [Sphingomonas crocodyli]
MKDSFRQSMAWLHVWGGLVAGWVLFFIFVTGTLGYFHKEIDRWMRPELPLAGARMAPAQALERADHYLRQHAAGSDFWVVEMPDDRRQALQLAWGNGSPFGRDREQRVLDATGAFVPVATPRETGGGYALYRMHWKLHYLPQYAGLMIVGLFTMALFVILLTGIVTHKKIFADFFTFRPGKGQRSWLDLHNLLSVAALPFFLMISFSGLVFYMEFYMPAGVTANFGTMDRYWKALEPQRDVAPSGRSAPVLPLSGFAGAAAREWRGGMPDIILVRHPGDAAAEVMLIHDGSRTIMRNVYERLHYAAPDGALLERETARQSPVLGVRSALLGLHEGIFSGWWLRWLYFASGLLGCGMIATGLVLWTVKRQRKQNGRQSFGLRMVECLNIGTLAGLPVGIAAYFWANRLLPVDLTGRAAWEAHCLFLGWGAMLLWSSLRPARRAWIEVLGAAAGLFAGLPLLNMLTTDRHLGRTLPAADWALASFDLMALLAGICFAAAALHLHNRKRTPVRPVGRLGRKALA